MKAQPFGALLVFTPQGDESFGRPEELGWIQSHISGSIDDQDPAVTQSMVLLRVWEREVSVLLCVTTSADESGQFVLNALKAISNAINQHTATGVADSVQVTLLPPWGIDKLASFIDGDAVGSASIN